jgi:DNA polymerase III subunit delta'
VKGEGGLPEADRAGEAPHPRETTALVGHAAAERAFLDAYRSGRMPHAWIIGGPEGVGKATLAWRVARFLLANPDPQSGSVQRMQNLDVDPASRPARQIAALSSPDIALLRQKALHGNPRGRGAARKPHVSARGRRQRLAHRYHR